MKDLPTLAQYIRNWREPPIDVRHAQLERFDSSSPYRSKCPKCERGLLLIHRDRGSLRLLANDRCVSCGQAVRYIDAEINGEPVQQ